jgi:hypothetical protein
MTYYKKILFWENNDRHKRLLEFRALVLDYFNNSKADWMVDERIEKPKAQEARVQINRVLDGIHDLILYAGIDPSVLYTPPPAVGGYRQNIDLVNNIFNLHRFQISPNSLLDIVDRAIGIYYNNSGPAFRRTINPFFYLGLVFDAIAGSPFMLLGRAGFNRKKAEESLVGRLIKGSIYLISALASLLTVLQLLGYLESAKMLIEHIVHL